MSTHEVVKVSMGEFKAAAEQTDIITLGLGPCVGLAIYNRQSRIGYMAHTCGPETVTLEAMLKDVLKPGDKPSLLSAWVCGDAPDDFKLPTAIPRFDREQIANCQIRKDVIKLLRKVGIEGERLEEHWIDDEDGVGAMSLDCRKGTCDVIVTSLRDDLESFNGPDYDL